MSKTYHGMEETADTHQQTSQLVREMVKYHLTQISQENRRHRSNNIPSCIRHGIPWRREAKYIEVIIEDKN